MFMMRHPNKVRSSKQQTTGMPMSLVMSVNVTRGRPSRSTVSTCSASEVPSPGTKTSPDAWFIHLSMKASRSINSSRPLRHAASRDQDAAIPVENDEPATSGQERATCGPMNIRLRRDRRKGKARGRVLFVSKPLDLHSRLECWSLWLGPRECTVVNESRTVTLDRLERHLCDGMPRIPGAGTRIGYDTACGKGVILRDCRSKVCARDLSTRRRK